MTSKFLRSDLYIEYNCIVMLMMDRFRAASIVISNSKTAALYSVQGYKMIFLDVKYSHTYIKIFE